MNKEADKMGFVVQSLLPQKPSDSELLRGEMRKLRYSVDGLSKIIEITFGGRSINQRRRTFGIDPIEGG